MNTFSWIKMVLTTFYFQLHQPFRLHPDKDKVIWDEVDKEVFEKVARKCYVPATRMFIDTIKANSDFKLTFGMSGTFLEQAEMYAPEVIELLRGLYEAGKERKQVEILDETYHNSLASLFGDPTKLEFRKQVSLHRQKLESLLGVAPTSFRNTELIFNNEIAEAVDDMGYSAILCEKRADMFSLKSGEPVSPNTVFRARGKDGRLLKLLVMPRNRELSEDAASGFLKSSITSDQYAFSIAGVNGDAVLLGYDYESIGEHIPADKGIFDFWRQLPQALTRYPNIVLANPKEIAERFKDSECAPIDIPSSLTSSWAGRGKDTKRWLGSETQRTLFKDIEGMEPDANLVKGESRRRWRNLTASDVLGYIHESVDQEEIVHSYSNTYGSLARAAMVLTRKIDDLGKEMKEFQILKRTPKTPVIIITPETARLANEMGEFAGYVSGKSGGMGEVVAAVCKGLSGHGISVHLITLDLQRRFLEETGLTEQEWIQKRHELNPQNIHLVSSDTIRNLKGAYDGNPAETAAELQSQTINHLIESIRSEYGGRAIIHTNDWMAGTILAHAKRMRIPSLHTVHNTHTANIPKDLLRGIGLDKIAQDLYECMYAGRPCIDSHATAIKNATKISYVGQKFLQEVIQDNFLDQPIISWSVRQETKAKYAAGAALVIPNGISPDVYPENQKDLYKRYGPEPGVIEAKRANLVEFQKRTGLTENPNAILFYWPSRLDPAQKGVCLLEQIAQKFVDAHPDVHVQIAVVGDPVGNDKFHPDAMGRIAVNSGGRIAYHRFDEGLSILGYAAASDVFGASLYEPFGQIDVVGNIYGATATNRDTGGYSDKITPLTLKKRGAPDNRGNGVLFKDYNAGGLWWGLRQALDNQMFLREHPDEWERETIRIMQEAREEWGLDDMVAGYIQAYEVLNGGKPLV